MKQYLTTMPRETRDTLLVLGKREDIEKLDA